MKSLKPLKLDGFFQVNRPNINLLVENRPLFEKTLQKWKSRSNAWLSLLLGEQAFCLRSLLRIYVSILEGNFRTSNGYILDVQNYSVVPAYLYLHH